jgi:hypothetical protein
MTLPPMASLRDRFVVAKGPAAAARANLAADEELLALVRLWVRRHPLPHRQTDPRLGVRVAVGRVSEQLWVSQ